MLNRSEGGPVMVTGAAGFLGFRVLAALLALGLEVSAIVQAEQADKLAALGGRARIIEADVWNRASLKGLARGHRCVVHLVGSSRIDPARGLTYQQINLVSARNVIGMATTDAVPQFVLLSAAGWPPFLPGEYLRSKREAEEYLGHSGLNGRIIRAPRLYLQRNPLNQFLALWAILPPSRWLLGRYLPLSVETAARGISALVNDPTAAGAGGVFYANDLRRLARRSGPRGPLRVRPAAMAAVGPEGDLENTPFGWLPPAPPRRR
jgi:nucleoside-diphosphate-sugar epimerase